MSCRCRRGSRHCTAGTPFDTVIARAYAALPDLLHERARAVRTGDARDRVQGALSGR